jgi:hypothetical protein
MNRNHGRPACVIPESRASKLVNGVGQAARNGNNGQPEEQ